MNALDSLRSIMNVAGKEFLHIVRDWRILVLILTLPPAFTLLFGHAFEETAISDAPAILRDEDKSEKSELLIEHLHKNKTFAWRDASGTPGGPVDLLAAKVRAVVTIPPGLEP